MAALQFCEESLDDLLRSRAKSVVRTSRFPSAIRVPSVASPAATSTEMRPQTFGFFFPLDAGFAGGAAFLGTRSFWPTWSSLDFSPLASLIWAGVTL